MSLDTIAAAIGADNFNRLVNTYPEAKRIGRLKVWQQKLLAKAATVTDLELTEFDTFIDVFKDAATVRISISLSNFLADPSGCWYDTASDVDPNWISEAWGGNPAFVENLSNEISRSVSKTGEFTLAAHTVAAIQGRLSSVQYAELYEYIRDDSQRMELEWRAGFVHHFPEVKPNLPPERLLIETRLLRCLRTWRVTPDAAAIAHDWWTPKTDEDGRTVFQEICNWLEFYICGCIKLGPKHIRDWWSDGVADLQIAEPEPNRLTLLGVSWIGGNANLYGIAPFEIDLELDPNDGHYFAKTLFRIGMLDDYGRPIVCMPRFAPRPVEPREVDYTHALEIRPRHNRDWAMAVELTPPP